MIIEIDYNPTPNKMFFISVSVNDEEAISFDHTTKAHRVIKQVVVDSKPFPDDRAASSEWDVLVLKDGKFVKKYHNKWIDLGERDWCNNKIWKTVKEQQISNELAECLLDYSRSVSDNYEKIQNFPDKIKEFELLLIKEIDKFLA